MSFGVKPVPFRGVSRYPGTPSKYYVDYYVTYVHMYLGMLICRVFHPALNWTSQAARQLAHLTTCSRLPTGQRTRKRWRPALPVSNTAPHPGSFFSM
jgi:hypothetical protein